MLSLRRIGYEVSFAAADMRADDTGLLAASGITCCHAPWHGSVEEVLRREAGGFDLVYLHRASIAARYLGLVGLHQPRAHLVYSVADLHHLRLARQAEVEQRPELAALAQRYRAIELQAAAAATAVITHSPHEAALLRVALPNAKVHVIPWSMDPRPSSIPFAERHGVGFLGHYGHAPNLDAATWLIDDIAPLLRAALPGIVVRLAGSDMPASLRKPHAGVDILGQVSDPGVLFDSVRLTVAPMAYGAGIKGKVLQSLAAGVPCVCTPVAAEGLDLPESLQSLIAVNAKGLAASIVRLHENEALHAECAAAGLDYVATRLSEPAIDALMRQAAPPPLQE